jgi:hypothetical protein
MSTWSKLTQVFFGQVPTQAFSLATTPDRTGPFPVREALTDRR